jgi:hypothetical protein
MTTSRFDRIATGLSMLAAGPLILAGMLTSVWEQDDSLASYLQTYLVDPGRSQLSAVLLHFGYLLLLPALLGLAMVTRDAPRLRAAGLLFGIPALATLPGVLIIDFYDMALAQTLPLDQAVAVAEKVGEYPGTLLFFLPTMVGLVLSFVLLGVAAWRAGFVPWWSAAVLVVGVTLMTMHRGAGLVFTVIEVGLLTIGLSDIGRRLLSGSPVQAHALDTADRTSQRRTVSPATRP